ncbi:hypothetical protein Tco_1214177 [Tanacetum coccineum]
MQNLGDISNPTTALDMAFEFMSKAFQLNNTTQTNNNQRIQNQGIQNAKNQNGLIVISGIANQNPNRNGNVVIAQAEGNANGNNGNQIRCYNCQGDDHLACNCRVKPGKQDAAYLQKQMQIALKEEAGIQLTQEEFDFMADAGAYEEIERQYTKLLEPIPESHQVLQNDSNVISKVSSVEQSGGIVEQHPATLEETRALYDSLYNNLATEVEKVNSVNRKFREYNVDLTTELARYKNQEKCFEISQEKYDKLERCYQKSVYQEQCLTKKINALHLSSEKKRLKSNFKIREEELLDKQIQLKNKIKELDNILVKMGQSIQTMHMLSPKPDSFYHTEQNMALELSDDATPSVARKFLNEVKSTIVTLQCVVKQKMTLEIHNWLSSAHQEIYKNVKDEIFPIVNQIDARVQNFKIQFLKEAAKFVRDFQSLAKEADESLAKYKALELEI